MMAPNKYYKYTNKDDPVRNKIMGLQVNGSSGNTVIMEICSRSNSYSKKVR